jgi:hypothetical protein
MAVSEPCYITREAVKKALDIKMTARSDDDVDRAIQGASRQIDSQMRRVFYPRDTTRKWDWPNYQRAAPWRLWLDQWELAAAPTDPAAVVSGGVTIPIGDCFFEPFNSGPPFTYLELDRSTVAAFSSGSTPQRSISITGTYGYNTDRTTAGALAANVTDLTGTTLSVTNGAAAGVGDIVLAGTERMLLADKTMSSTGRTQTGPGCSTNNPGDTVLTPSGGTFYAGETLLMDGERMLVVDLAGANIIVKRGWDGTSASTHTGATIYTLRSWTVTRGALGTPAATHTAADPVSRYTPPSLISQLALAEAENNLLQGLAGYARTVGSADNERPVSGASLADIRKQAYSAYARQARSRVV